MSVLAVPSADVSEDQEPASDALRKAAAQQLVEHVDADGRVLEVVPRAEMRARTLRHRSVYIAVLDQSRILVHRRAHWKDVYPGAWDLAFGGICDPGETWAEAAHRELAEEAGIAGTLVDRGPVSYDAASVSLVGRLFTCEHPGPFAFDDGEVIDSRWIEIDDLASFITNTPVPEDSAAIISAERLRPAVGHQTGRPHAPAHSASVSNDRGTSSKANMKPDLQTAKVRPSGDGGIAHRTSAGFVMLATADGQGLLPVIEEHHRSTALIEQIVQRLRAEPVRGFVMLFTSDGAGFALLSGTASAAVSSDSAISELRAAPERIALIPLHAPINDRKLTIVLRHSAAEHLEAEGLGTLVDLHAGTLLADSLEVQLDLRPDNPPAVKHEPDTTSVEHVPGTVSKDEAVAVAAEMESLPELPPPPATATEDAQWSLGQATEEPDIAEAALQPAVTPLDENAESDIPEIVSRVPAPSNSPGQPAAAGILFAPEPPSVVPSAEFIPGAGALGQGLGGIFGTLATRSDPDGEVQPETQIVDTEIDQLDASTARGLHDDGPVLAFGSPTLNAEGGSASDDAAPLDAAPIVHPVGDAPRPGPVMVLGLACPNGHHNHPDAVYCSQCGAKMGVHNTTVLLNGPRPPLGVLVVDDGSTWPLTSDMIIGREPSAHPNVVAGGAQGMTLSDDSLAMSRQHARVSLDEWSVYVEDLQSSNGTFINRDRSAQEWSPVPSSSRVPVEPGDRLRIGGRLITVELHHVR